MFWDSCFVPVADLSNPLVALHSGFDNISHFDTFI